MTEPKFVPKTGQTDYTNIRYAPVINCVVVCDGKILLVKRNLHMRLYPNYWNGISGFLDDQQSITEKVHEELREELHLLPESIRLVTVMQPLLQEAAEYSKTWLIVPVRVEVATDQIELDWEAIEARWFAPEEVQGLRLLPGFSGVLEATIPDMLPAGKL